VKTEILAVISFITVTMAYLFTPVLPNYLFFDLIALAFSLMWLFIYLKSKGWWSITFFVFFLISLNNLADELFFDPIKYDLNELSAAILIALITIIFKKKWTR
jgi:hypothetical protein